MNSKQLTQVQLDSLNTLYSQGKINETIKLIDTLIIENPNESILFNLLGACQSAQEELESALQSFKKRAAQTGERLKVFGD